MGGIKVTRRCGKCGIEGHNARSCNATNYEIENAEYQANLETPTVVHMGGKEPKEYYCGAKRIEWPHRCMDDSFARTLPLCSDCITLWREKNPEADADFIESWDARQ